MAKSEELSKQEKQGKKRSDAHICYKTKLQEAASGAKGFNSKNFSLPQMHYIAATAINNAQKSAVKEKRRTLLKSCSLVVFALMGVGQPVKTNIC